MAIRTVVCPECDEAVPYGRLSCPNCGSLLAAVAGGQHREPLRAVAVEEESALAPDDEEPAPFSEATETRPEPAFEDTEWWPERESGDAVAATTGDLDDAAEPAPPTVEAPPPDEPAPPSDDDRTAESPEPAADGAGPEPVAATPDVLHDWSPPAAVDEAAPDVPWSPVGAMPVEAAPDEQSAPAAAGPPPTVATPDVLHDWTPADTAGAEPEPEAHEATLAEPEAPQWPAPVAQAARRGPLPPPPPVLQDWTPGATPEPVPDDDEPLTHPWAAATPAAEADPGRMLYPSAPRRVSGTSALAGSWVPPSVPPAPMRASASSAAALPATPAQPARELRPGAAPLLADLPFDAPDDLPGWLVTIGAVVALVGFLLPWSAIMIGAESTEGYTSGWGLATPSHLLVLGLAALAFALAIVPNRVPAWFRTGVLGLALGGLLVGLAWPYVLVLRGAGIGVLAVALAGGLLIAGGILALRPRRHEGPGSGV